MKDEIKEFNKENGNVTYTVKELLGSLHVKFDKHRDNTDKKLEVLSNQIMKHHKDIAEGYVTNKTFRWFVGGMGAVILFVVGLIIRIM